MLLKFGADSKTVCNGSTAQQIAEQKGHTAIADLLKNVHFVCLCVVHCVLVQP